MNTRIIKSHPDQDHYFIAKSITNAPRLSLDYPQERPRYRNTHYSLKKSSLMPHQETVVKSTSSNFSIIQFLIFSTVFIALIELAKL